MLTEIRKLRAVRAVGLPAGLFADAAPKVLPERVEQGPPARFFAVFAVSHESPR